MPDLANRLKDLITVKLLTKNSEKNFLVSPAYFPYDDIEILSSREVQDLIKCQPSMSAFGGRKRYVWDLDQRVEDLGEAVVTAFKAIFQPMVRKKTTDTSWNSLLSSLRKR